MLCWLAARLLHEARKGTFMRELAQDLRHALRALRRSPATTAISISILAVAIGASAALWQALDVTVLRPLPFPDSNRLVAIWDSQRGEIWTVSPPNFTDYRDQGHSFVSMAAFNDSSFALSGKEGSAEQVPGTEVTSGFFHTFGIGAALGRTLGPADDHADVVVLSDGLWRRRYGEDPGIVGKTVRVDGKERTVVGVLAAGRGYPFDAQLWVPLAFSAETLQTQRGAHWLRVVGRLREGATLPAAQVELRGIAARLAAAYPKSNDQLTAVARDLQSLIVRRSKTTLSLMLGAVSLALLAACANLASLSLARTVSRRHELALKASLGAGSRRLARTLWLESFLLAMGGAVVGAELAVVATRLMPVFLELPRLQHLHLDTPGVLALAVLSGVAGLLLGAAPATFALRRDPAEILRASGHTVAGARSAGRIRRSLVVATTALALILVAGATLLTRSYHRIAAIDPGFETSGRLLFSVSLPSSRYPKPEDVSHLTTELDERLRALPGVEDAAATFGQPLGGFGYQISLLQLDGRNLTQDNSRRSPAIRVVTPSFFRALGIPVLRGRTFTPDDRFGAPNVVVANQAASRLIFGGIDPIGHTLRIGTRMGLGRGHLGGEIVGVVGDIREQSLTEQPAPTLYFVQDQFPVDFLTFVVRSSPGRLDGLIRPIRTAVAALDPDLPIFRVRTLDQLLANSLATERTVSRLFLGFALLAVVLAALGLFGVLSQSVTERRRELAVRSALGAMPVSLAIEVLRQAGTLAAIGVAAGLAAGLPLVRYLRSVLYQLSPTDPLTLCGAALGLIGIALVASLWPARRAFRLDPIAALREE